MLNLKKINFRNKKVVATVLAGILFGELVLASVITINWFLGKFKDKTDPSHLTSAVHASVDPTTTLALLEMVEIDKWPEINQTILFQTNERQTYPLELPGKLYDSIPPAFTRHKVIYYTFDGPSKEIGQNQLILWAQDFDGANKEEIFRYDDQYNPAGIWLSPDQQKVAFTKTPQPQASPESSTTIETTPPEENNAPTDNNQTSDSLTRNQKAAPIIAIHDFETGQTIDIVPSSENIPSDGFLGWSSDSSEIFFLHQKSPTNINMRKADLNSQQISNLFTDVDWSQLDWPNILNHGSDAVKISPDQKSIAFLADVKVLNNDFSEDIDEQGERPIIDLKKVTLNIINTQSGVISKIFETEGHISELRWSPNAEKISYKLVPREDDVLGLTELRIIDRDGYLNTKFARANESQMKIGNILWDQSSQYIYYVRGIAQKNSELLKVDLKNFDEEKILNLDTSQSRLKSSLRLISQFETTADLDWQSLAINQTLKSPVSESAREFLPEELMDYLDQNINQLSPISSPDDKPFSVSRFGFVSPNEAYVEYQNDDSQHKILVTCHAFEVDQPSCSTIGVFQSSADGWQLISGEDPYRGKKIRFYQKIEGTDQWEVYSSDFEEKTNPVAEDEPTED